MQFHYEACRNAVSSLLLLPEHGRRAVPVKLVRRLPLVERNLTRRVLKPIGEKLGIPWLYWHVFPHSHSTFGEQIAMALSDRPAQMGHLDIGMTMHYTHSDLERRGAAIETIATRLVGKEENAEKKSDSDTN
jgi:integrase